MDPRAVESIFFGTILTLFTVVMWSLFAPFLIPLAIALILAIVFRPLHNWILRRMQKYPAIAAFISVGSILLIILIPLSFIGVRIGQEILVILGQRESFSVPPGIMDLLHRYGPSDLTVGDLASNLNVYVQKIAGWLLNNLQDIISRFSSIFADSLLLLIALYYFLKDGDQIYRALVKVTPISDRYVEEVFNKVGVAVNSVVRGSLVVALFQGIAAGAGFFFFGVPNAVFLGTIAVFAALIPLIGTGLVVIPAMIYYILLGKWVAVVGLGIWNFFVVGLIDNFLRPHLMRRDVAVHPLLILLSVLGGLEYFGPIGFLLGPVVLSLFAALVELFPHVVLHSGER